MPILYDAIIAFLCCAGIAATFHALFSSAFEKNDCQTCMIVSENEAVIVEYINAVERIFNEIIVVTNLNLEEIDTCKVRVVTPEDFEVYVAGND